MITYLILFGLVIVVGLALLLYWQIKKRNLTNRQLLDKNTTISTQNEEKELLLKEIHHRVKNNLQIVSSLLELQAKKVSEIESEVFKEGQSRVKAMALIHEELYQNEDLSNVDFTHYTDRLSRQIQSIFPDKKKVSIVVDGPRLQLDIDTAIPLGLILNELVTNAFKYGLTESGNLHISYQEISEGNYKLSVKDDGAGLPADLELKRPKSLGLRLVTRLSKQLYGNTQSFNDNGAVFQVEFKDTLLRKEVA